MRRAPSEETDDDDDKDNVTIKSMIISMVRVCIFVIKDILSKKNNLDASSIVETNDMSSNWLDWLFCNSFIFY
jgi:hypothetical protein